MLEIDDLSARIGDTEILRGVTLAVGAGEVHTVMGPNGAGKSTLARVLAGAAGYDVAGQVRFCGHDLLALDPEARAAAGLFVAFQHPVEIPGVANAYFLRTALNAVRRHQGQAELSPQEFLHLAEDRLRLLGMDRSFMARSVNEGFSGGEKKRNEILQLAILEPRLAILDETDSGLDIDALRAVAAGVNALRSGGRALLLITHHQQLLELVVPDRVHVMIGGRIVRSGGRALAQSLEQHGYAGLDDSVAPADEARSAVPS
jgi:Fe-S cluster assembly ATP-binding protein